MKIKKNLLYEIFEEFEVSGPVVDPVTFESRVEITSGDVRIAKINISKLEEAINLYGDETVRNVLTKVLF